MRQKVDQEYIDMYHITPENFWLALEHMGRYAYAAWMVGKRKYKSVLDVACSNGFGCEKLADAGTQVVGVDINEQSIAAARERHRNREDIRYSVADVDGEGWADALDAKKYDAIVCFEAIEHVRHPEKLLCTLATMLKPNARLLLSVPAAEYESLDENGHPVSPYHQHVFSRLDISAMLAKAGLSVERMLGQPDMNRLMRKHNTFCSRNEELVPFTTTSFKMSPESIAYYIQMFAYPEKGNLKDTYSHIYVLKRT
ncbi:MAG: class I SAM-dependent methyltransferase [Eubacteriales bacterium]